MNHRRINKTVKVVRDDEIVRDIEHLIRHRLTVIGDATGIRQLRAQLGI